MKYFVLLVVAAASLAVAPIAEGSTSINYKQWTSRATIQDALIENGVDWSNAPHESISSVNCEGFGRSIRHKGVRKYRDFYCLLRTNAPAELNKYYVRIHILGQRFGEPRYNLWFWCYPEDC